MKLTTNQKITLIRDAAKRLAEAHSELNYLWLELDLDSTTEHVINDTLESDYPYAKCFDELNIPVQDWCNNLNELK